MVTQLAPTLDQVKREVPERPRLAPGVRLAGQMQESAFVDPPWLVERQGVGYVQLPRPLYRIAELSDGQHTLEDIAREVTLADGRHLSADNIRHLIARQFVPNGIVPNAAGEVVPPPRSARSALAIARMKSMDARTLDGFTRVLQAFFWPAVLLVVLSAAALIEGWLYLVHGLGGPLHDVFYLPGYLLLALTLIIASAAFHELGHAAALRYAGGRPRSFGFGMYLMYPVFFTDVSDNYWLRRWARVRTDLGGFYFNLIVALAVFAAYVLTRQEALLVFILLINFEIIQQLLPVVRLDGYWTLVDLTGIPDFFSQMGAFVRTILPFARNSSGRRMAPLKWWGKAVFLGYIVVTIPALIFLLFLMLRSVPRVLATAWDALGQQGQALLQAQSGGDLLGMAGAVGQSVLLLLPVAGMIFALYRMGTGVAKFLWRWSAPSAARRGLAGAAGLAFAGLLCALWVPQIPFLGNRPSPVYQPDAFTPIGRDERFSVTDVLTGRIVPRPPDAELPDWMPRVRVSGAVAWVLGRAEQQPGAPPPPPPGGAGSGGGPGAGGVPSAEAGQPASAGAGQSGAPSVAVLSAERTAASSPPGSDPGPGSGSASGSDASAAPGAASGAEIGPGSGSAAGSGATSGAEAGQASGSGATSGAAGAQGSGTSAVSGAEAGSAAGAATGAGAAPGAVVGPGSPSAGEAAPAAGSLPDRGSPGAGAPGAPDVTGLPAAPDTLPAPQPPDAIDLPAATADGVLPPASPDATGLPGAVDAVPAPPPPEATGLPGVGTAVQPPQQGAAPASVATAAATAASGPAAGVAGVAQTAVPAAVTAVPGAVSPPNAPVNANTPSGVVPSHHPAVNTNPPGPANPAQPLATAVPSAVTGVPNTVNSVPNSVPPVPGATTPVPDPGATVPGGTVPGGTVPGGTVTGGTVPGGITPGAAATPVPAVDPLPAPGSTPGSTTPLPAPGAAITPSPAVDPLPAPGATTPVPAAGQQPLPPVGQAPAPATGQQPASATGQQPVPPTGQAPAPASGQSPPPAAVQPAAPAAGQLPAAP